MHEQRWGEQGGRRRSARAGGVAIVLVAMMLASGFVAGVQLTTTESTWEERAPTPTSGGYGEAVAGTGTALYVIRCYSAASTPLLWKYDPGTDAWTTLSTSGLPTGAFRNGATLTWDGGDHLYALGGARYSDADRRDFWRYSLSGDAWTRLADSPHAQGAGDAATWSGTDGALYALLGSSGHGAAFARYDPGADAWTLLAAPLAGIDDGASLAWAGDRYLFALRGEYHETSPPVRDFWRYDTVADAWESRATFPDADGVGDGGSLLWIGAHDSTRADSVYALAGNDPAENPGYDAYRYSVGNDSWSALPALPYPVGNFNGNRLGFADGHVHYWQGTPSSYAGGGDRTARLLEATSEPSNSPPVASFTFACTELACSFDGSGSTDSDGTISSYAWDFGDGATATGATADHSYAAGGTFTVTLTVTDDAGATGSDVQDVTVSESASGTAVVVVNEVESNPAGSDTGVEWVELHNAGDATADLTGWTLVANGGTPTEIALSGTLDAGAFLVVTHPSQFLDNSNEWVSLLDAGGALVDETPVLDDGENDDRSWQRATDAGSTWEFRASTRGATNGGTTNSPPTASFTFACTDLACSFDGSGSADSDGTISSYAWDFGDGSTGSGVTVSHTFGASGDYTVTLTVTDDAGATDTASQVVSVSDGSTGGITLGTSGYKVKGVQHVDLSWSGATSTNVDVYRDGALVTTTANDGAYTDNIGQKGSGTYTYKVCEAGTTTCSNESTVVF